METLAITGTGTAVASPISYQMYEDFISYVDASPKTIETYRRCLKQFFVWLDRYGIRHPQREDVISYREDLKEAHKPTTVQTYMASVRLFFKWTAQRGLYPNIADNIKGAKLDKTHKKKAFGASQVRMILSQIDRSTLQGLRDYAMLSLMVTAGLRTIEVSRANIEDLTTVSGDTVLYIQGKGHEEKAEFVNVPEQTERALRAYLAKRGDVSASDPLFCSTSNNSTGERLTTRSIRSIAKKHFQDAGFFDDKLTAHSLRHTAVTLVLQNNGHNIYEAQQFARHASPATTEIYAHELSMKENKGASIVALQIYGE